MKYYKIIVDNNFVGVIDSGAFLEENPRSHRLRYSTDIEGQFVDYYGTLYRDYWMLPIDSARVFTQATITEITQEEYEMLKEAIDSDEPVIIDDDEEEEIIPTPDPQDINETIRYMRQTKISQMSKTCRQIIENGFDLVLRNQTHHFSLDTQDQLNLISLSEMAKTQELIPYHADGEICIFYTANEINKIVTAATSFKIYHTTDYNALKGYINALDTLEDISAIQYGTPIPEAYKSDVLKALENENLA